jgi:hypothetical protein
MKQNIYQKLHKACCEAGAVKKADKVAGMKFNPLLHDSVQTVAMEALLSNGLYPVCTYENQLTDSFIMTTCTMRIHDIEKPEDSITIAGTSALGNLDKFGSGNSMSYAKKYAFLNALNLKTGMDSEDGYETKPFKINKESNATKANDPDGTWWNQAAFASKDEVGGLTIILTPSNSAAKPAGGFQQKTFAAKPTYGKTNTGFNKF